MGVNVNWVPRHAEMTLKMDNHYHIACDTLRNPQSLHAQKLLLSSAKSKAALNSSKGDTILFMG